MYLSRVALDWENRKKMSDLTDAHKIHGWVESCFPEEITQGIRSRKLWRIDSLGGKEYLLLLSETIPNHGILQKYGVNGSVETRDYSPLLNKLEKGMVCRFRVAINPVISISQPKGRGRVVPHVTVEQTEQFLFDRATQHGFRLEENQFSVVSRSKIAVRKPGAGSVSYVMAVLEGKLTIEEPELFKRLLIRGLGKKKAYGFGLMTILPV